MIEAREFIDLLAFDRQTAAELGTPVDSVKAAILLYALPASQHEPAPLADSSALKNTSGRVKFARQVIENSCGLMAILHLLMNDAGTLWTEDPLMLKRQLLDDIDSPIDAGNFIANVEELYDLHHKYAGYPEEDGQVEDVLYHFVAAVPSSDGREVVVFDGRRAAPIVIGAEGRGAFGAICAAVEELKAEGIEILSALALV